MFLKMNRPVCVRRQANPHRPGISPALGLRAKGDGLVIVPQTAFDKQEAPADGPSDKHLTATSQVAKERQRLATEQPSRCLLRITGEASRRPAFGRSHSAASLANQALQLAAAKLAAD
jgi:hypothetical protein